MNPHFLQTIFPLININSGLSQFAHPSGSLNPSFFFSSFFRSLFLTAFLTLSYSFVSGTSKLRNLVLFSGFRLNLLLALWILWIFGFIIDSLILLVCFRGGYNEALRIKPPPEYSIYSEIVPYRPQLRVSIGCWSEQRGIYWSGFNYLLSKYLLLVDINLDLLIISSLKNYWHILQLIWISLYSLYF